MGFSGEMEKGGSGGPGGMGAPLGGEPHLQRRGGSGGRETGDQLFNPRAPAVGEILFGHAAAQQDALYEQGREEPAVARHEGRQPDLAFGELWLDGPEAVPQSGVVGAAVAEIDEVQHP